MGNPFFNANQPGSGMGNMMQQFMQFKNAFRGDPRQEVQNLLNSGRMTQQQFNQLSQLANQFQSMIKR